MQSNRLVKQLRAHLEDGAELTDDVSKLTFRQIYTFAEAEYVPAPVKAPLLLLRATKGDGSEADKPEVDDYVDADLGWSPLTQSGLKVVDVLGGHSTMLQEPHVASAILALQSEVDQILASRDQARTGLQNAARNPV
jgi:thioesterase domain-containing protein